MANPGRIDQFEIWEKTKTAILLTVSDGAGNPKDLSGFAVRYAIALRPGAAFHVVKATGGTGITFIDASTGQLKVILDQSDVTLPNGQVLAEGVQELILYSGGVLGGDETDRAKGEITIHDAVFETET